MSKKSKFKPEVTKIALNPEQAVLTCDCFSLTIRRKWTTTYWLSTSNYPDQACNNVSDGVRGGGIWALCQATNNGSPYGHGGFTDSTGNS